MFFSQTTPTVAASSGETPDEKPRERPASPLLSSLLKNEGTLQNALKTQEERSQKILAEVQKQGETDGLHIVKVVDGGKEVIEETIEAKHPVVKEVIIQPIFGLAHG